VGQENGKGLTTGGPQRKKKKNVGNFKKCASICSKSAGLFKYGNYISAKRLKLKFYMHRIHSSLI